MPKTRPPTTRPPATTPPARPGADAPGAASAAAALADLDAAIARSAAAFVGRSRVRYAQHARVLATAVRAFGDDPAASLYAEGSLAGGEVAPPDLVLLHPAVGVLVVEVKGVPLDAIHAARGTELQITRDGRVTTEDPFQQASDVMFAVYHRVAAAVGGVARGEAMFHHAAAMPRVGRTAFEGKFRARMPATMLFAESCADPAAFRRAVLALADARHARLGGVIRHRLSPRAATIVRDVVEGRSFLPPTRRRDRTLTDPALLGSQAQELELQIRPPTEQQRAMAEADLRGHHRLYRGVAGSGKSVSLAICVGGALERYWQEAAGGSGLFAPAKVKTDAPRVLVACFNKSLVPYLRGRIEHQSLRISQATPAAGALTVAHVDEVIADLARAAPGLDTKLTFLERDERAARMVAAWEAMPDADRRRLGYDAVYLDEAQDLAPDEVRLLRGLARPDARTGGQTFLVFYDDAQNIYGRSRPTWSDLGVNIVGRTEYLDVCLRNTRQTIDVGFNVLVGSFAPEGRRARTRTFADVQGLRDRGLIAERGGRLHIGFAPREGPPPSVSLHASRDDEVGATADLVRRLVTVERVRPSDVLVLLDSPAGFDRLDARLKGAVGDGVTIRRVDKRHEANKRLPLIEDGVLTVSTVASAKGYDAPVVVLVGADRLTTDRKGRALFYVAATRARLALHVSGLASAAGDDGGESPTSRGPSLLGEIVAAARAVGGAVGGAGRSGPVASPAVEPPPVASAFRCALCGSSRLNAQAGPGGQGPGGHLFRCIDCTEATPFRPTCPACGSAGAVRADARDGRRFHCDCPACGRSAVVHENARLGSL